MSEADDWAPVQQKAADDDWQPVSAAERPAPTAGDSLPEATASLPEAFIHRLALGMMIGGSDASPADLRAKGFEDFNFAANTAAQFKAGLDRAKKGFQDTHSSLDVGMGAFQALTSPISAAFQAVGGAGEKATGGILSGDQINTALMLADGAPGTFSRVRNGAEQVIGGLPTPQDFTNAGKILAPNERPIIPEGAGVPISLDGVSEENPMRLQFMANRTGSGGRAQVGGGITIYPLTESTFDKYIVGPRRAEGSLLEKHSSLEAYQRQIGKPENLGHSPEYIAVGDSDNLERVGSRSDIESYYNDADRSKWRRQVGSFDSDEAKSFAQLDDEVVYPTQQNLRSMWQDDGIHPAEAVHDAQQDAFLKHDITAKQDPVKLDPETEQVLTETGGRPGNLSAARTDPADIPLDVQPASPPGSLAASWKAATDKLTDIGRDAQMLVTPMVTGTRDSMAIAKDFANSIRRNRWDWSRTDSDIADRFTPEQRTRMWNAADEESLSLRLGEPESMREHQGLNTLEPDERAMVEDLQTRSQNAWVRARDAGMVEGEGLPAYTPRMIINVASAGSKDTALALDGIGGNLRTKTGNLLKRKYMEAQDTEAAAKAKYGDQAMLARDIRVLPLATSQLEDAIAGRNLINSIKDYGERTGTNTVMEGTIPNEPGWFTLDHPAFKTWRPKFEDGKAIKDENGNTIFEQVPLYVHGDFEGPLRAVLSQKSGALYQGMMAVKGKTMSLIMNSPMIHNAVEWGRAFPAAPFKVGTFKVYFEGNAAKNNVPLMHEAIDNGLVPIGHRFFNQDITSVMESPDLSPGRSLTSKIAAFVPGLFDEAAGTAVKQAIDKAGDFWHNTLLWDRVADLQMGLYKNFLDAGIQKGMDRATSAKVAAHLANRYAGSLPKEAMSDGATKIANLLLFSRSFTLGNLGVMKDMMTGLPKDVMAQIERDAGFNAGSINAAGEEGSIPQTAVSLAKSMARRKAISTVALDVGLLYVGNSVMQSALNVMLGSNTLDQEAHGYVRRFRDYLDKGSQNPLSMLWPSNITKLSSTSENEPGLSDRLKIGQTKDGTAIYARNPVGKIGEEFVGWGTSPLDILRRKEGTIARPLLQILSNDAGFGRKIYDPDADTPTKYAGAVWAIAKHLAGSQLPEGQITALSDLVKGEGDKTVNELQLAGPLAGVTFRKGAPGGPAVGEMYHNKSALEFRIQQAMPDVRKQIQRRDVAGAKQVMTNVGMDEAYQRWVIKTTQNPATRLGAKALRDFYRTATPEQRERMTRIQQAPQPPQ